MEDIIDVTRKRGRLKTPTCKTSGGRIWSYDTMIYDSGVLNITKYSPTTTTQQNAIRYKLPVTEEVDGIAWGADRLKPNLLH